MSEGTPEDLRRYIAILEEELDADRKHAALGEGESCPVCTHLEAEQTIRWMEQDELDIRAAKAEAWDEGYDAGARSEPDGYPGNPYRDARENALRAIAPERYTPEDF